MAENQNSPMRMPRSIGSYHTCRLVLLRPGHMARDCQRQLDVRGMTYNQMAEYFKKMKASAKDQEELAKKKDFSNAAQ